MSGREGNHWNSSGNHDGTEDFVYARFVAERYLDPLQRTLNENDGALVAEISGESRVEVEDNEGIQVEILLPEEYGRDEMKRLEGSYSTFDLKEIKSKRLSPATRFSPVRDDLLTERQRQVLESALDKGYYSWPREQEPEDVAEMSRTTVLEKLRRVMEKVGTDIKDEPGIVRTSAPSLNSFQTLLGDLDFQGISYILRNDIDRYEATFELEDTRTEELLEHDEDGLEIIYTRTREEAESKLEEQEMQMFETAHDNGFYGWPREIGKGDLAEKLDVDVISMERNLRSAEGKIADYWLNKTEI